MHWRGGEVHNVTLIPFKWHLWSRDIILIYPLNPPFAALFAAITHTFFIICIVFCVNYVDLRSSQGNFSLWKWNEVQIIQDWTREPGFSSSTAPPPPGSQLGWLRAVPSLLLALTMHNNFLLKWWWVLYLHHHLSIIYLLHICVGHWYGTLIMTLCSFRLEVWIFPLFARSASSLSRCQLINKSQKLVRRKLSERHWSLKVISCQILHEHPYYLRICLRLHWTLNWQERWRNEVYSILLHKFHTLRSIVLYCNYCTEIFSCNWFRNKNRKMPGAGPDID